MGASANEKAPHAIMSSGASLDRPQSSTPDGACGPSRAWLENLPEDLRNSTAQYAHRAARAGAMSPTGVLLGLALTLGERRGPWGGADERERLAPVVEALFTDTAAALRYAVWVLHYERLSPEEKARWKAERGRQYQQEAMASKAPSERQIAYLCSLGYTGPAPATMAEASVLIEARKRGGD